jgi:hypothetical protein
MATAITARNTADLSSSASARPGLLRRLADTVTGTLAAARAARELAHERSLDRAIAAYIEGHGGVLTDEVERVILRRIDARF